MGLRFFRFCVSAGLSLGLSLALTVGLHRGLGLPAQAAYAIALVAVFVLNFFVARLYVFRADRQCPRQQFLIYTLTSACFRFGEYGLFTLFYSVLHLNEAVAVVLAQGLSFIIKFFFYGRVVFKPNLPESEAP